LMLTACGGATSGLSDAVNGALNPPPERGGTIFVPKLQSN